MQILAKQYQTKEAKGNTTKLFSPLCHKIIIKNNRDLPKTAKIKAKKLKYF